MLHVQQHPIQASAGQDFGADGAAQVRPQTDLGLT